MVENPNYSDTRLPIRDRFIVCGGYVVDAKKVVAVSSVHPDNDVFTFTVLLQGCSAIDFYAKEREAKQMREDFLVQWRDRRG